MRLKSLLLIVFSIIIFPFYYICIILLAIVGISTMNENGHFKKLIDSSKTIKYIYTSIILVTIMIFLLLLPGAIYFTPNVFDYWNSLINLNFKKSFDVLAEPIINAKENFSLAFKLFWTIEL
jgi:hypothetical protein